jgi:hypothetical protein
MKKIVLAVVMAMLFAPFLSFAETVESVTAELNTLAVKKSALEQELIQINRQDRDLRLKLNQLKYSTTAAESVEPLVEQKETVKTPVASSSFGAPVITKPLDGEIIPMTVTSVKVEGTAPEGTRSIIVNGYTLSKFVPGDRTWVYYASPQFSTMKEGPNFYTAVAVDKDGNKTVSNEMALYYGEPPADEMMPEAAASTPVEKEKVVAELKPTTQTYPYKSRVIAPFWENSDFSTLDRAKYSGSLERVYEQNKQANEKLMRYRNIK